MIYDYLIIGGGISGAAAGYELAAGAQVAVLEGETIAGYHSTGRSAALFTPNFGGPVVRRINAASHLFFKTPPVGFCDLPLLTRRGALTVASSDHASDLDRLLELAQPDAPVTRISVLDALGMAPFLRPDRVVAAVYEQGVTDIKVALLHQCFLKGLKARGGEVMTGQRVVGLDRGPDGWQVSTDKSRFCARVLINAAGAWADQIGEMVGAAPIGLVPKRRTGIIVDAPAGLQVSALPAVDFFGSEAYIKPDAGLLMASPGDATPTAPQDARPEEMDIAILADWIERETLIPVRRIRHSWAGLRSFVPDEAPVVGFDADVADFFWLAGQGGYGIMMAPVLAQVTAAICSGKTLPKALLDRGVSAKDLSPARLSNAAPFPCNVS
jgi:D-arginine dehydrogenase